MQKEFICTRPGLAGDLISAGFPYRTTASPWKEGYTAWVFPINKDLVSFVTNYYNAINKIVPRVIATWQDQEGGDRE